MTDAEHFALATELRGLDAGPETPDFFADLWRRASMAGDLAVRRWRRLAVVATVTALSAASAAIALAANRPAPARGVAVSRSLLCELARSTLAPASATRHRKVTVHIRLVVDAGVLVRSAPPTTRSFTSTCNERP
jgi:hypothetical protein